MLEEVVKKLKAEIDKLKIVQRDYHKALAQRQQLDGQLNENVVVKEELDLLSPESEVFKLIGPVLIKQDLNEAKQNVAKRVEYISAELKRVEDTIPDLDKKQESLREVVNELEDVFVEERLKATVKAFFK
ncbi:prefoldin subunit 6 [Orussus abietinus]|uniref:prefoldin subunit 6 n=1 Tax=Orussus abietinus TaxID=222816 RepID=UPI000625FAB3|nr:prefoldin subunit 6 [Orussus abietinus]